MELATTRTLPPLDEAAARVFKSAAGRVRIGRLQAVVKGGPAARAVLWLRMKAEASSAAKLGPACTPRQHFCYAANEVARRVSAGEMAFSSIGLAWEILLLAFPEAFELQYASLKYRAFPPQPEDTRIFYLGNANLYQRTLNALSP